MSLLETACTLHESSTASKVMNLAPIVFLDTLAPAPPPLLSVLSSVVTCLATLYFNVLFHDDPHVEGSCKARDIPYDCLAQLHGEAYHAWHHVHPRAYHRPGLDATYWCFILPGLMLGFFEGPNIVSETKSDGAWSSGVIKRDAPGEPEKTLPQGAR
jgi:hypothetical protein